MSEEEQIDQQSEDYREKYFRLLADMENLRKRVQKEKQEMTRFAIENVLADFLSPLDNLESALSSQEQMSEETKQWAEGFSMISKQLSSVLEQHGVSPFTSLGLPFDPHCHEAMEVEETEDSPEGLVLHEYVRGYRTPERVVRVAKVKVSKRPLMEKTEETIQLEE